MQFIIEPMIEERKKNKIKLQCPEECPEDCPDFAPCDCFDPICGGHELCMDGLECIPLYGIPCPFPYPYGV